MTCAKTGRTLSKEKTAARKGRPSEFTGMQLKADQWRFRINIGLSSSYNILTSSVRSLMANISSAPLLHSKSQILSSTRRTVASSVPSDVRCNPHSDLITVARPTTVTALLDATVRRVEDKICDLECSNGAEEILAIRTALTRSVYCMNYSDLYLF